MAFNGAVFNPGGGSSGPSGPPKRAGMREQSRKVIADALSEGRTVGNEPMTPAMAADEIEDSIFEQHPDEKTKEYRAKLRNVAQGLKGPRNAELRSSVLHGIVSAEDVVTLDAKTLEQKAKESVAKLPPSAQTAAPVLSGAGSNQGSVPQSPSLGTERRPMPQLHQAVSPPGSVPPSPSLAAAAPSAFMAGPFAGLNAGMLQPPDAMMQQLSAGSQANQPMSRPQTPGALPQTPGSQPFPHLGGGFEPPSAVSAPPAWHSVQAPLPPMQTQAKQEEPPAFLPPQFAEPPAFQPPQFLAAPGAAPPAIPAPPVAPPAAGDEVESPSKRRPPPLMHIDPGLAPAPWAAPAAAPPMLVVAPAAVPPGARAAAALAAAPIAPTFGAPLASAPSPAQVAAAPTVQYSAPLLATTGDAAPCRLNALEMVRSARNAVRQKKANGIPFMMTPRSSCAGSERMGQSPGMPGSPSHLMNGVTSEEVHALKEELEQAAIRERDLQEKVDQLVLEQHRRPPLQNTGSNPNSVPSTPAGEMVAAKMEVSKLTMEVLHLQRQLEDEKETALAREKTLEDRATRLEGQRKDLEAKLVAQVSSAGDETQARLVEAEAQAAAGAREAADLRGQVEELRTQGDILRRDLEDVRGERDTAAAERDGLIVQSAAERDGLMVQSEDRRSQVEVLDARNKNMGGMIERLEAERDRLKAAMSGSTLTLEAELDRLKAANEQLEQDRKKQADMSQDLQRERDEFEKRTIKAEAAAAAAEAAAASAATVATTPAVPQFAGVPQEQFDALLLELHECQAGANLQISEEIAKVRGLEQERQRLKSEVDILKLQVAPLQASVESLQRELETARKDRRQRVTTLLERTRSATVELTSAEALHPAEVQQRQVSFDVSKILPDRITHVSAPPVVAFPDDGPVLQSKGLSAFWGSSPRVEAAAPPTQVLASACVSGFFGQEQAPVDAGKPNDAASSFDEKPPQSSSSALPGGVSQVLGAQAQAAPTEAISSASGAPAGGGVTGFFGDAASSSSVPATGGGGGGGGGWFGDDTNSKPVPAGGGGVAGWFGENASSSSAPAAGGVSGLFGDDAVSSSVPAAGGGISGFFGDNASNSQPVSPVGGVAGLFGESGSGSKPVSPSADAPIGGVAGLFGNEATQSMPPMPNASFAQSLPPAVLTSGDGSDFFGGTDDPADTSDWFGGNSSTTPTGPSSMPPVSAPAAAAPVTPTQTESVDVSGWFVGDECTNVMTSTGNAAPQVSTQSQPCSPTDANGATAVFGNGANRASPGATNGGVADMFGSEAAADDDDWMGSGSREADKPADGVVSSNVGDFDVAKSTVDASQPSAATASELFGDEGGDASGFFGCSAPATTDSGGFFADDSALAAGAASAGAVVAVEGISPSAVPASDASQLCGGWNEISSANVADEIFGGSEDASGFFGSFEPTAASAPAVAEVPASNSGAAPGAGDTSALFGFAASGAVDTSDLFGGSGDASDFFGGLADGGDASDFFGGPPPAAAVSEPFGGPTASSTVGATLNPFAAQAVAASSNASELFGGVSAAGYTSELFGGDSGGDASGLFGGPVAPAGDSADFFGGAAPGAAPSCGTSDFFGGSSSPSHGAAGLFGGPSSNDASGLFGVAAQPAATLGSMSSAAAPRVANGDASAFFSSTISSNNANPNSFFDSLGAAGATQAPQATSMSDIFGGSVGPSKGGGAGDVSSLF